MLVLFEGEFGPRQTQRFIEEVLHVGHWSWDLDSGVMQWSRGLMDLLGIEPETVRPCYAEFEKCIHAEDRMAQGDIEQMLRSSIAVDREFRIINSSGRIRWVSLKAEPIGAVAASPNRAAGICYDITRHREELQLLQRGELRLKTIGKLTTSLFWIARPDGSLSEFLNLPDDMRWLTMMRPTWEQLIHEGDNEAFVAAWRHAIESRQDLSVEHRLRASDGTFATYWTKAAPWIGPNGQIREWIGISRNLSESMRRFSSTGRAMTGTQMRSARAILNWSVDRLSQESGIRPGTIRRLEDIDGALTGDQAEVFAVEKTLSDAGIEFTFYPDGKPGVRPR
ncbi:MAG: PAS domain-containing protein [Xanthobacteraceae bacterium]